jgi:phage tail-like protein
MTVTLRLECIEAVPHPLGNRIDLKWFNPQPDQFDGVLVRRKETTYPVSEQKGEKVAELKNPVLFNVDPGFKNELDNKILSPNLSARFLYNEIILSGQAVVSPLVQGSRWYIRDGELIYLIVSGNGALDVYGMSLVEDTGLRAETVYYYAFFPYKSDLENPEKKLYIYDRCNRASAMATGPYDFAGQMHRRLPIIYHRYDTALPREKYRDRVSEQDMKRGQLRRFLDLPGSQLDQLYSFATAALDFHDIRKVDGKLLPLLAQWIGWDTDHTLEIADQRNELKNAPAMYRTIGTIPNIEAAVVKCISGWETRTKEFVHNIFLSNRPEQLNLWLCQKNKDGEWEESNDVFSLDFAYEGRPAAAKDEQGNIWLFYHTVRNNKWDIWYKIFQKDSREWTPSQPLTGADTIDKYPTAVFQGNTLWVAWNSFNRENQTWQIKYKGRTGGQWSETRTFNDEISGTGTQCKSPQIVVDKNSRPWYFWLEKEGDAAPWQLKYNLYDGEKLAISPSPGFPADEGKEPRVEKDLFVLYCQEDDSIWVFWVQERYIGDDGQRYWQIAFRKKSGTESIEGGWGPIQTLPKETLPEDAGYDDCEPAAVIDADGRIELFWVSNRGGSWTVWYGKLADLTSGQADAANVFIDKPYSRRTPLPLPMDEGISLLYRSNRGISYKSDVYGSTVTTDFRYAGCTTMDARNEIKNGLGRWQKYEDFLTYTYDTGKNGKPTDDDWYARDTIGLYLTPNTEDQPLIIQNRELVKGVLERFLPIQTRSVFIINPPIRRELIYTYDFDEENPRHIEEHFEDQVTIGAIPEVCPRVSDTYEDNVPEWTWFRTVKVEYIEGEEHVEYMDHRTVNVDAAPIDTGFRTWHIGIKK